MALHNTAQVVIGAQFGDEGKGRMIDYYAARAGGEGIVIPVSYTHLDVYKRQTWCG